MTSAPHSLYSTTAMMRTGCQYIPFNLGHNCTAEIDKKQAHKKPKNMLILDVNSMKKNKIDVNSFWKSIPRKMVPVTFSNVAETTKSSLRMFWHEDTNPSGM